MANVVKKYSISSELATENGGCSSGESQRLGVSETWRFSIDGGNLKALAGWMGPRCLPSRCAEQSVHRSVRRLPLRLFQLYPGRPSLLAGIPRLRV